MSFRSAFASLATLFVVGYLTLCAITLFQMDQIEAKAVNGADASGLMQQQQHIDESVTDTTPTSAPVTASATRDRPLIGGLKEVDLSDPNSADYKTVHALVGDVLQHVNRASNSLTPFHAERIISAKKQVVAGMKYWITLEMRAPGVATGGLPAHPLTRTATYSVWVKPGGKEKVIKAEPTILS